MCNVYQLTVHKYLKLFLKGQSHEILRAANAKQVPGIPLEVYYLFLNFYFHTDFKFKVFPGLIIFCYTQQRLSVRPQIFLLRRACSALQIRFKTTAANLARWNNAFLVLSYNICCRLLIKRSENFSWQLHLPATILLAGSKNWGLLLLVGYFLSCKKLDGFSTCHRSK